MDDRLYLRRTFDSAAELYGRARPQYPAELFDVLMTITGLQRGDRVLEIGCATGQATRPLAERGLSIVCVELGEDLATVAERELAAYANARVINADFESWTPTGIFDLVAAATAWHWLNPTTRYRLAWEALRPGGDLAFWSATHVIPENGDPFFVDIQDVYDQIGQSLPSDWRWPRPGQLPDSVVEIETSGLFCDPVAVQFDWEVAYTADAHIDLLNTFSGHIAMSAAQRTTLFDAIRDRISQRPDGYVTRHWGAVLYVAKRADI